ncbi:MAG: metalloregulator ArsR/SmtB family transcription factor [Proteobacteria bacterium]|nr:metalloregulator ArsR/SmtB family transcription factor [Pseudomonadota bacterium]
MVICQEKIIHIDKVRIAAESIPESHIVDSLVEIFKALSDPTRLKIVIALSTCELCVCDIAAVCNISESAVSHHLKTLRMLKIVQFRKEGKIVYYRLDDEHVDSLIKQSIEHASE